MFAATAFGPISCEIAVIELWPTVTTVVIGMNSRGVFHMMLRKIGFALAASAGVMLAGAGVAGADETTDPAPAPSTGSAEQRAGVLGGLLGGGATTPDPADVADEDPAPTLSTGSADSLAGLLGGLLGGGATTPDPADVADEATPDTGSADLLTGLLPLLISGSAGGDAPAGGGE